MVRLVFNPDRADLIGDVWYWLGDEVMYCLQWNWPPRPRDLPAGIHTDLAYIPARYLP